MREGLIKSIMKELEEYTFSIKITHAYFYYLTIKYHNVLSSIIFKSAVHSPGHGSHHYFTPDFLAPFNPLCNQEPINLCGLPLWSLEMRLASVSPLPMTVPRVRLSNVPLSQQLLATCPLCAALVVSMGRVREGTRNSTLKLIGGHRG